MESMKSRLMFGQRWFLFGFAAVLSLGLLYCGEVDSLKTPQEDNASEQTTETFDSTSETDIEPTQNTEPPFEQTDTTDASSTEPEPDTEPNELEEVQVSDKKLSEERISVETLTTEQSVETPPIEQPVETPPTEQTPEAFLTRGIAARPPNKTCRFPARPANLEALKLVDAFPKLASFSAPMLMTFPPEDK
ncbi:MAG: hypothetical protein AAGJ35_03525, partial [Myxococcota bacterium]